MQLLAVSFPVPDVSRVRNRCFCHDKFLERVFTSFPHFVFRLDVVENPLHILAKTPQPILEPELDFETSGLYNGCVFPTGNVIVDGELFVYYGSADKYVCVATCAVDELLDYLLSDSCRLH